MTTLSDDNIPQADPSSSEPDPLDLLVIYKKLKAGFVFSIGSALVCMAIATCLGLLVYLYTPQESMMRVAFAFAGLEKSLYPDGSKFSSDDLRAADVVADAVRSRGGRIAGQDQTKVRGAITVTGIVPANILKERDRIRASGQTPPTFIPDEYSVSFGMSGRSLTGKEREAFLSDLATGYLAKFRRTYVDLPPQFGKAFETLESSDFFEYELILHQDLQMLETFLADLSDTSDQNQQLRRSSAVTFRSPTTGYSFNDLLFQVRAFSRLKITGVMGIIQSTGLSKDRQLALIRMKYRVSILAEDENRLNQEEAMIRDLMEKTEARGQSYVLGVKSSVANGRGDNPMIDQGLLDTLVRNDSYNYLVRRAVDAGLRAREVASQKNELMERSERMAKFAANAESVQVNTLHEVEESLKNLKRDYDKLVLAARQTYEDYTRQEFSDAIRISQPPSTKPLALELAPAAAIGAFVGLFFGLGLSLIQPSRSRSRDDSR